MNEILNTLCKIIDFSNLYLVVTDKNGIIVSVSNRISERISILLNQIESLNGKCWYDYIDESVREDVIEQYKYISEHTSVCSEITYSVGLINHFQPVKWIVSFVNHEYNFMLSIGMPVSSITDEIEFENIRNNYLEILSKDREKIIEERNIIDAVGIKRESKKTEIEA